MAWEMVEIRSWRHYWNDYIVKGLQNGQSTSEIHNNVIEAMRKEVFGQLIFRGKVHDIADLEESDKNNEIVQSVAKSTLQKFNALMRECKKYKETKDILVPTDFDKLIPDDEEEEDVEEPDEKTAEWPELSEEDEEPREENTHISEGDVDSPSE